MRMLLALLSLCACRVAAAQFDLLDAHTTASLRGVDALSDKVAWASGSAGTVLLTTDGGTTWKHCTTPAGAEKLDLRGVQALDAQTAVVMASGPGAQSALYRTTDSCTSWTRVFTNPDAEGFFDSLRRVTARQMYLLGDPVAGRFSMFYSADAGVTWLIADDPGLEVPASAAGAKPAGAFAASNSDLIARGPFLFFGTAASAGELPAVYRTQVRCKGAETNCPVEWVRSSIPLASGSDSAGVFSLGGRYSTNAAGVQISYLVAVGGDYRKPEASAGTAAWSADGGTTWQAAAAGPAGYRSAVAYVVGSQRWLAVGPSGVDVSRDDGRRWEPLKPTAANAPGADAGWNAISLPFVVGAKGKIGRLQPGLFKN